MSGFTDVAIGHDVTGRVTGGVRLVLAAPLAAWFAGRRLTADVSISHLGELTGAVAVWMRECGREHG